jgi:hypothetical protein
VSWRFTTSPGNNCAGARAHDDDALGLVPVRVREIAAGEEGTPSAAKKPGDTDLKRARGSSRSVPEPIHRSGTPCLHGCLRPATARCCRRPRPRRREPSPRAPAPGDRTGNLLGSATEVYGHVDGEQPLVSNPGRRPKRQEGAEENKAPASKTNDAPTCVTAKARRRRLSSR